MKIASKDVARFWSKVKVAGPADCWEWQAGTFTGRYGRFKLCRKDVLAHRVSYAIAHGDIPADAICCHSCDNMICVNPAHLWLGTMADNHHDRDDKGRGPRGSHNGRAKLTEAQVLAIRETYAAGGHTYTQLGKQYGVAMSRIGEIVRRIRWQNI